MARDPETITRDDIGLFLPHEPTEVTRAEVMALVSFGNTQEQIASYLDITKKTLEKHYRRELDTATIRANAQVAKRLYNKAVQQDDLQAQIFWLKTRARWRTVDENGDRVSPEDTLSKIQALVADLNKTNMSDI